MMVPKSGSQRVSFKLFLDVNSLESGIHQHLVAHIVDSYKQI